MQNSEPAQMKSKISDEAGATNNMKSKLGFNWSSFVAPEAKIDSERAYFRAKRSLINLVHDMTSLEGNPFTYPEVKTLLEGTTVGGRLVTDQEQVLNTAASWSLLLDKVKKQNFALNKENFLEIHAVVAKNEALLAGSFRDGEVGIGGTAYKPPTHNALAELFENGLPIIQSVENVYERAFVFFLFGALNQFFWDGNKRTSRLMAAGELLKAGVDMSNIPASRKLEFNEKMIQFYDSKDGTEMMSFLTSCILI